MDRLPRSRAEVVELVRRGPRIVTVEESTRDRDLLLTVLAAGLRELAAALTALRRR